MGKRGQDEIGKRENLETRLIRTGEPEEEDGEEEFNKYEINQWD